MLLFEQKFSGIPEMSPKFLYNISFISNQDEIYYLNSIYNTSIFTRMVLDSSGVLQRFTWLEGRKHWVSFWSAPRDQCDVYASCGAFATCNSNNATFCKCLHGFEPISPQDWYLRDWSSGCARRTRLNCGKDQDGFLKLTGVKLPDTSSAFTDDGLTLEDCKEKCLNNCSCTAYANSDINGGGSGCIIWIGNLMDLQEYSDGGQELYLRLATSDLGSLMFSLKSKIGDADDGDKGSEMPLFNFGIIEAATSNFSHKNKLGEGGFGSVYQGKLPSGQEIAVKRLSKSSGQGLDEFKNEVILITKLQHRNLVRLLGCSLKGEEKILIYEFMSNKSLDYFLFDRTKSASLDWQTRFNIISGIARGLLYLHQDSRLRIIHRDLKPSNILLDDDMNPKISDFGIARIFGGNQTQENTDKVVGTYGYMSPEYAMNGLFSVKSDVFSFGVLLLEIVSGKKSNRFYGGDDSLTLLGYVWELWTEGRSFELMDPSMSEACPTWEVVRCIHIGLLCVQELAADRPNIASIVFMLGSETAVLPPSKQPAFSKGVNPMDNNSSVNTVSITMVDGR